MEYKAQPDGLFNMHFEYVLVDGTNIRMTLTNLYPEERLVSPISFMIPVEMTSTPKWTIACLDFEHYLDYFQLVKKSLRFDKNLYKLKSFQICANVTIRGIFTSNKLYDLRNLPKEMDFKPPKGVPWDKTYSFVYHPVNAPEAYKKREAEKQIPEPKKVFISVQQQRATSSSTARFDEGNEEKEKTAGVPMASFNDSKKVFSKVEESKKAVADPLAFRLLPNPIMRLKKIIGFTGIECPDIKWLKMTGANSKMENQLLYAAGSIIVRASVENSTQEFLYGHTSSVSCLTQSSDASLLVSCESGKSPSIRLWNLSTMVCTGSFPSTISDIKCLSLSPTKKSLAVVGQDKLARDTILIFDLTSLQTKKQVAIHARQLSDSSIIALKHSPFEDDKLVSCGKENIRFLRIKKGHLPGAPVILNHHARNTVFTCLDFEQAVGASSILSKVSRVFVGERTGLLFEIDFASRELQAVYKLHASAITSVSVCAGYCVTGSEDQFVRVWPLDFSEFKLEAKHEGAVIGLDVSSDCLKVASGTANGSLGFLDLGDYTYRNLIRTHSDEIIQVEFSEKGGWIVSLSKDGTIRVWDCEKLEQSYEFTYPKEDPCLSISVLPGKEEFAGGFGSGTLRIFSVTQTKVEKEYRYHENPIKCVKYRPDGRMILVVDGNGLYTLLDVTREYAHVKTFEMEMQIERVFGSFSADSSTLATLGSYSAHINLWDIRTFQSKGKINLGGCYASYFEFARDDEELLVGTSNGKIRVYKLPTPEEASFKLVREAQAHSGLIKMVTPTYNHAFLVSIGLEGMIKVFDYNLRGLETQGGTQSFQGHCTSVNALGMTLDNRLVFTGGGSEGLFVWEFFGDLGDTVYEEMHRRKKKAEEKEVAQRIARESQAQKLPPKAKLDPEDYSPIVKVARPLGDDEEADLAYERSGVPAPHPMSVRPNGVSDNLDFESKGLDVMISQMEQGLEAIDKEEFQQPLMGFNEEKKPKPKGKVKFVESDLIPRESNAQSQEGPDDSENEEEEPEQIVLQKQLKEEEENQMSNSLLSGFRKREKYKYLKDEVRDKHDLPFKHYYLEQTSTAIANRVKKLAEGMTGNPKTDFSLDYVIGYNGNMASSLIWNTRLNYVGYIYQNKIIIEELTSGRSQRIANFPDYLSCIALHGNGLSVAIGTASPSEESLSPIYICDAENFSVSKKLAFHSRGVAHVAYSHDYKMLVSIGNFRDGKIAVWNVENGDLLANHFAVEAITDVKWRPTTNYSQYEFITVGGARICVWSYETNGRKLFTRDHILSRDDLKEPVLTSLEVLPDSSRQPFLALGFDDGELQIRSLENFSLIFSYRIASEEITSIHYSSRLYLASLDGCIYYWDYSSMRHRFDPDVDLRTAQLQSGISCIAYDCHSREAVVGTVANGISYLQISENAASGLVGATPSYSPIISIKWFPCSLVMTVHFDGAVRLWTASTGEFVRSYYWEYDQVQEAVYVPGRGQIVCFGKGYGIRTINAGKLSEVQRFVAEGLDAEEAEENGDFVAHVQRIEMGENKGEGVRFLLLTRKGKFLLTDFLGKSAIVWRVFKVLHSFDHLIHKETRSFLCLNHLHFPFFWLKPDKRNQNPSD